MATGRVFCVGEIGTVCEVVERLPIGYRRQHARCARRSHRGPLNVGCQLRLAQLALLVRSRLHCTGSGGD